jgi:hypothetical protein
VLEVGGKREYKTSWGRALASILIGASTSKVTPVVRLKRGSIELVMDEKLKKPLMRIGGRKAEEAYKILAGKFLTRRGDSCSEILIPVASFPAVSVWLLASYTDKPSEELLDELLYRTPKVLADLFWDLVELSQSSHEDGKRGGKPFIDHKIALKASKVVRDLLELYKLR